MSCVLVCYRCSKGTGSGNKIDAAKIYVFGESEQSDDTTHFMGRVRAIARASQAAVLTLAEVRRSGMIR